MIYSAHHHCHHHHQFIQTNGDAMDIVE